MRKESKKAILLVAFGTSVPEAAKAFGEIEKKVREKYPGTEVRWAFTSKTIRSRASAHRIKLDSPETAFRGLMDGGFTRVAVLSLHVVPGEEFQNLCRDAERFQAVSKSIEKIEIARPLLANSEDIERVSEILAGKFARPNPDEGSIFIGHGNKRHPSDAIYAAMNCLLMDRGDRLFTGTVEGNITPDELVPKLKAAKIRKVTLVPLMAVAGAHARKDMAGNNAGSWKSVLAKSGIESEPVFTGLAENPDTVTVWLDHLGEAFSKL
ncbi:MAG: sirohydrochlorin cobaltochelatase [Syntrophobacteraceae bacterium]|jgi:sirohydrochlorin cobaltochelatase